MKYNYETVTNCANILGAEKTFTPDALEVLMAWGGSGDDVLWPMLSLLEKPFTDEAIEFMEKNPK